MIFKLTAVNTWVNDKTYLENVGFKFNNKGLPFKYPIEIEINTIEELMSLINKCGTEVVVYQDQKITIYNDYME